MTHQPLPSGTTDADRFARSLALLRGPEIQPADGTLVAEELRVLGQLLADGRATILRAVAQAHPRTATDLLPDLEAEYGLPDGSLLPTAERQRRLAAKYLSRAGSSYTAVLATLRALAPEVVLVTIPTAAVEDTDPTAVYRLVILVDTERTLSDSFLAELDQLLAAQAEAAEDWSVGDRLGFYCDDATSLCDVTLLDA